MPFFASSAILLIATSILTGFLVIIQNHRKSTNRLWLLFCIISTAIGITIYTGLGNFTENNALTYYQILIIALSFSGAVLFHFVNTLTNSKAKKTIILFYIISSILAVIALLDIFEILPNLLLLKISPWSESFNFELPNNIGLYVFWGYYLITIMASLLLSLRKNLDSKPTKWLTSSSIFVWFLGVLSITLPLQYINIPASTSFLISPLVIIIGYVIIRFRTADPTYFARKGLLYLILTLYLIFIFAITIFLQQKIPLFDFKRFGVFWIIGINFIAALSIKPLQDYLTKLTNTKLFQIKDNYENILNRANRAIYSALEYDKMTKRISAVLKQTLGVNNMSLFIYNKDKHIFAELSEQKNTQALKLANPLIRLMKKIQMPVLLEDIQNWQKSNEVKSQLTAIHISSSDLERIKQYLVRKNFIGAFPLTFNQQLIGFLAIGPKISLKHYTTEDIKLLNTLTNQISAAIENANLYQELKESEQTIRQEHDKTQSIITNLTDGLIVVDQDDNIILANPAAKKLFPKKRLLGTHFPEELEPEEEDNDNEKKQNPFEYPIQYETTLKSPRKTILKIVITPLFDQNNKQIGLVKILHNITRDKEIDKIKSDFIRTAAHKLRTPLSATKWILKMIVDGDMGEIPKDQKAFLEKGYQSNERMISVVNELLNVSEIEEGKFNYYFQKTQITDIIDNIITELTPLNKEKGHKLNYTKDRYIPEIKADPHKLYLAIKALVLNAIQYTNKGGKIKIKVENLRKEIKFTITDDGLGIPDEQQNELFTKFMRGDNVVKIETEGNGLGLFIAKNIIVAHKGKIGFESTLSNGSTFYFTIPTIRG